jgi:hypothetical protein
MFPLNLLIFMLSYFFLIKMALYNPLWFTCSSHICSQFVTSLFVFFIVYLLTVLILI